MEWKGASEQDVDVANIQPQEHPSDPLTGQYVRHGGKLTSITTSCTLLLVTRKDTTPAKAQVYVLQVLPNGKRTYVSSLWEGPSPGSYAIEYRGRRYTLTMTGEAAVIAPVTSSTGTPNAHVHQ